MKKRPYLLIVIALLFAFTTHAQSEYKTAIGGRVGNPFAFSIKHFLTDAGAIEGYAGFSNATYSSNLNPVIGGMYQHHFQIGDIPGFKWYVGGGVLLQFYSYKDDHNNVYDDYGKTGFGLNGVGGIDYKFKSIPLNLSADWMPTIFLTNVPDNFYPGYGSIAARYTF